MEFEIIENSSSLVKIVAKIPIRKLASEPKIHLDTGDVTDFLTRKEITVRQCLQETVLSNYSEPQKLEGEWVFLKIQKAIPKKKRKVNDRTKPKTKPTTDQKPPQRSWPYQEDKLLGTENLE